MSLQPQRYLAHPKDTGLSKAAQTANSDHGILDSKEADAARAIIAAWVRAFYANLEACAGHEYVDDRITDYDPCGPDWPDDNADDVEPKREEMRR